MFWKVSAELDNLIVMDKAAEITGLFWCVTSLEAKNLKLVLTEEAKLLANTS